jgi:hypothetical protein
MLNTQAEPGLRPLGDALGGLDYACDGSASQP